MYHATHTHNKHTQPQVYSIAANSVFTIPLWRHVFTWVRQCRVIRASRPIASLKERDSCMPVMSPLTGFDMLEIADRSARARDSVRLQL